MKQLELFKKSQIQKPPFSFSRAVRKYKDRLNLFSWGFACGIALYSSHLIDERALVLDTWRMNLQEISRLLDEKRPCLMRRTPS
jgi:hypothetical protein